MKIKYLKPAPLGSTGDVAFVPDNEAKVLIMLGIAKPIDDKPVKPMKGKRKAEFDLLSAKDG